MGSLKKCLSLIILVSCLLSLLSPLLKISEVYASPFFEDGFESGWTPWTGHVGNVQISTLNPRNGTYSARFYTAYMESAQVWKLFTSRQKCSVNHYVYFSSIPSGDSNTRHSVCSLYGNASSTLAQVVIGNQSGTMRWGVWISGIGYTYNTSIAVSTGSWLNITQQVYVHSSLGYYTLYVGTDLMFNFTNLNNAAKGWCYELSLDATREGSYGGTIVRYDDDVKVGVTYSDFLPPTPSSYFVQVTSSPAIPCVFSVQDTTTVLLNLTPKNLTLVEDTYNFTTSELTFYSGLVYVFLYWLFNSTEYHARSVLVPIHGNTTVVIYRIQQGAPNYVLFGAYNEQGFRNGAINVTCWQSDTSPTTFNLNGIYNLSVTERPISFRFTITTGTNETRTYYIISDSETIYVFKPEATDYYLQYYIMLIDFVGIHNAYLESLLNINGSDRIVERWLAKTANEMPFTFVWGTSYKMRLVCDEGIVYLNPFTAGATTSYTYTVTPDMFPVNTNDTGAITVWAWRHNATWIQSYYSDGEGDTLWVNMAICNIGSTTVLYSSNVSSSSLTLNWYDGNAAENYWVNVTVKHARRGYLYWYLTCAYEAPATNPWNNLDTVLGTSSFPIAPSQFIAISIVLACFLVFSERNWVIGLGVGVVLAMILTYIGWLSLSWSALSLALGVIILIGIGIYKDRSVEIEV